MKRTVPRAREPQLELELAAATGSRCVGIGASQIAAADLSVSPPRLGVCRRRPVAATVRINVDRLRAEMEARGITGRDLAKEAGISEGTLYNALSSRPILVRNAKLIAGALERIAIEPALARLVVSSRENSPRES